MWQQASKTTPRLATTRLRLRPIKLQDNHAFYEIYSDAETLRYWSDAG